MKTSGKIVETKSGKQGKVYNNTQLIKGRIPVYIDGYDAPILCDPLTLKIVGYFD